jgi:uncharacterized protein YdhG (YjbR/CyaY superfamily)
MTEVDKKFNNIDEYIGIFSENIQTILKELRQTIKQVAPDAKEAISYQMPTFKLNGNLVHFAVCKNHIGFYPTPSAIVEFKQKLSKYETSKGAIKFPIDEEIPLELVKEIVRFRVIENNKIKKSK